MYIVGSEGSDLGTMLQRLKEDIQACGVEEMDIRQVAKGW